MKKANIYKLLTAGIVLISVICAAVFWFTADFKSDNSGNQLISLDDGWYYYDTDGKAIPVTLPCTLRTDETLTLYHDNTDSLNPGKTIATYGAVYDIEMYAGDELIYQFLDNGREVNNAVRGNIVCSGVITEARADDGLRLVYHSTNGVYRLSGVTVSEREALVKSVFVKSLFCLIVSFSMLVMGLLALALGVAMATQHEPDHRIICIGVFLLGCGLWCLSDSAFVHMIAGYSQWIFSLDFYLFMLMPIPLAYFVLCTGNMNQHKMILAIPMLYYINIIVQSLLAAAGVFTFFRMLFATHFLMMFSGVLSSLNVLIKAYWREKSKDVLLCIKVLASVGILGAVAILLYEFFGYSTYQLIYQTGLLLLMSVLLSSLLQEFIRSVRYRAEAIIYKQLSEQDKLTGLDNRRSFDALTERMENGSLKYRNAALVFMDVNFLKKANDTYGHDFGDKLLISAAGCIRKAFESIGYCYRIGGDEFCAVILNPSCPQEELLNRIHTEAHKVNLDGSLPVGLSIACGCSYICENGEEKPIDKWKAEADSRMYEEKKRIKAIRND